MKSSLFLIICLLFIVKNQDTTAIAYSINPYIDYLQENGYWSIIREVKLNFGKTVSIEFCLELVPSPHCEETVLTYIDPSSGSKGGLVIDFDDEDEPTEPENPQNPEEPKNPEDTEDPEDYYLDIKYLDKFLEEKNYMDILSQKIPISKLEKLINKIKEKYK